MLGVAITPGSVQDRDQIAPLLKEVRRLFPFLERAIADSGYQGATTAAAVKKAARLPYTREVFDETMRWIDERGIFADTGMGSCRYESSIATVAQ